MKAATMQGPLPDPVRHSWSCTKRGPYRETLVQRPTGQATIRVTCEECGGSDDHEPEAA